MYPIITRCTISCVKCGQLFNIEREGEEEGHCSVCCPTCTMKSDAEKFIQTGGNIILNPYMKQVRGEPGE